jgi:transposase
MNPELVFMQDNAPAHKSVYTRQELAERGIQPMIWPPYSPDLNLIEHVWAWMKDYIAKNYAKNLSDNDLINAIETAWRAVPESFLESLIDSMEARVAWVLDNQGGHSKY